MVIQGLSRKNKHKEQRQAICSMAKLIGDYGINCREFLYPARSQSFATSPVDWRNWCTALLPPVKVLSLRSFQSIYATNITKELNPFLHTLGTDFLDRSHHIQKQTSFCRTRDSKLIVPSLVRGWLYLFLVRDRNDARLVSTKTSSIFVGYP